MSNFDATRREARTNGLLEVERGVRIMLRGLHRAFALDVRGDNFHATPERVARAYAEMLSGVEQTDVRAQDILRKTFPCRRDEMVIVSGVRTFSVCPHHLLPVDYRVTAAYLPSPEDGRVVGLSKLPRLIDLLARRPVLQEQFVGDVADYLMTLPGCRGSACYARGRHYCMRMRGARQPGAVTTTSSLRGVFRTDPQVRAEFLSLSREETV